MYKSGINTLLNKLEFINILKKQLSNPVVQNMILIGIITLFLKVMGMLKEIVIAGNIGLSELLDAFYIAMLIPSFVNNVFIGTFKKVFIPNYISEQKSNNNVGAFQSVCLIVTACVATFFISIAFIVTDVYLEIFFKGHSSDFYELIKTQLYLILPCMLFWGISSLLSGLLNIYNEFKYSSIYKIFTPTSIIICLFVFRDIFGEMVLAFSVLLGSIFEMIFLIVVVLKKRIVSLKQPSLLNSNIREFLRQIPAKISSSFLTGMMPFVDQFFAAQLVIGSISALNYGIKIPALVCGILLMSLGNVLLPYFSHIAVENIKSAFNKLYYILKWLFAGTICILFLTLLISYDIIELLFERDAFTPANTLIVSKLQNIFLFYIPFYVCTIVLVNFLTSINKNTFMAWLSLINLILNIVLDYFLMQKIGVFGIALSTTCVYAVNGILLLIYTIKQERYLLNNLS